MVARLEVVEVSVTGLLLLAVACGGGTGPSSAIGTGGARGGGSAGGGVPSLSGGGGPRGGGGGVGGGGAAGHGGSAGLGGTATTRGGAGTEGGDATQGGSYAAVDACPDGQVDCNGTCVGEGSVKPGCKVLATAGKGVDLSQGMAL